MNEEQLAEIVGALVLEPGDTLIVGFNRPLFTEEARYVKERGEALVPGIKIVVIDDVSEFAVYRDEEKTAA